MATLSEALGLTARNFLCSAVTAPDPFRNWLRNATSSVPGVGTAFSADDDFYDGIGAIACPAPDSTGIADNISVSFPPAGFEPGQCNGVRYRVNWSRITPAGTPVQQTLDSLWGPIEGIERRVLSNGRIQHRIFSRGVWPLAIQPPGTPFTLLDEPPPGSTEVKIDSLVRPDGQPDDCGAPVPQGGPTGTADITYVDNSQTTNNITINISTGDPVADPDGGFSIPFGFAVGNLNLDANFDVSIDELAFNFGGEAGAEACCPTVDVNPEDADEDDPPPPTSDKRLWGIKVLSDVNLAESTATVIGDLDNPDLHLPDLGLVRFAIEFGGQRGWTSGVRLQTVSQFVPVNAPTVAYDYAILRRPGVTYTVREVVVLNTENPLPSPTP
jgi:hypothetical protein